MQSYVNFFFFLNNSFKLQYDFPYNMSYLISRSRGSVKTKKSNKGKNKGKTKKIEKKTYELFFFSDKPIIAKIKLKSNQEKN